LCEILKSIVFSKNFVLVCSLARFARNVGHESVTIFPIPVHVSVLLPGLLVTASLDRLNLHRDPEVGPIVLAFNRHQHVEVLIAPLTRTLLERQKRDLAALSLPTVPEHGPKQLHANVVQTSPGLLFGDAHAISQVQRNAVPPVISVQIRGENA